jgi:uncharacterized SAM-binding protein YcdF (DUF218 family)
MYLLLTRVLLWIVVVVFIYYVLLQLIPRQYLAFLGALFLFAIIVLAFLNPNDTMVSTFWAILSFPLKPLGAALTLLLIGASKVKNSATLWAAFFILLLSSLPILSYSLAQRAEQEAIQVEQRRREICEGVCPEPLFPTASRAAAAIVVLGQGTTEANLPYRTQIQLTDTGDRILYAAQLYREQLALGRQPFVIVSAGPRPDLEGNNTSEASDIASILTNLGVPRNQIILEPRGVDLRTSAVAVERILRERGLLNESMILVSSGINTRRATLTFSNLGLRVIPRPTDFYTFQEGATPSRRLEVESFLPNVQSLAITTQVVEEFLSSIYYFLRGWSSPVLL